MPATTMDYVRVVFVSANVESLMQEVSYSINIMWKFFVE